MQFLLGERDQAAQVAAECLREDDLKRDTDQDDPYWKWATFAEACLNLGDLCKAAEWYRQAGDGSGGTAHVIERWRQQDLTVYTIDLANSRSVSSAHKPLVIRCEGPDCKIPSPAIAAAAFTDEERAAPVISMLFADVEGFSKLTDREVELFITHFLGRVARCVEQHAPAEVLQPEQ
jgi:class 3 adenylate cyclase